MREDGDFCLLLMEKKKIKRGNKNKLNHIPICTKQIMLSKPFEYKIIHYSTTLSIQSPELTLGGIEQGSEETFANLGFFQLAWLRITELGQHRL